MQRIVAVILVILLVAPPASAGQKPNAPVDWDKVQRLKPGTTITLSIRGQAPTKVRFLFADETMLVTLKPTQSKLSGRVERTLFSTGSQCPAILNTGGGVEDDRVRVLRDGVFDGTEKVGNLPDLVQQTPREDVLNIPEVAPHSHWVRNILIGFAIAVSIVFIALAASGYLES
jgi:hypothetical protein